jgi:hypothetical protein
MSIGYWIVKKRSNSLSGISCTANIKRPGWPLVCTGINRIAAQNHMPNMKAICQKNSKTKPNTSREIGANKLPNYFLIQNNGAGRKQQKLNVDLQ